MNVTPKHTPGPWTFNPNSCYPRGAFGENKCIKHRGRVIAEAVHTEEEEALANAALIAALPEILGCLQDLVHSHQQDSHNKAVELLTRLGLKV